MTVGERFRVLFEKSGLTKEEVARRTGLTGDQVWNRLQRGIGIQADEVPLLARALGKSVMAFYEDAPAARATGQPDLGGRFAAHLDADPLSAAEEAAVEEVTTATKAAIAGYRRSLLRLVQRDEEEQGSA